MFFICGISQGMKELGNGHLVICKNCGQYGRYQIFMTYTYFSLFFIPVFKWGRHYYVKMSCCQAQYELDEALGKRLAHGEQIEISEADLTQLYQGNGGRNHGNKTCPVCGYHADAEFEYCPKCGNRF